ncbi:MAG: shikimate dehydrogenase family protein [Solirubrobacteraceae bacterium]
MSSLAPAAASPVDRVRLGVLGWPVSHSRSPAIQNAALAVVGLAGWRYQLLPVSPELLAPTVRALPGAGFRGVNVTIPHKQAALALAGQATDTARAIGAANVLTIGPGGELTAANTDAPALIGSLPFTPAGRTALVLGAGGSARAAVWALLDAGAAEVRVWNRTSERARRLCAELGGTPVQDAEPADLLINCTSSGLDAAERTFDQLPLDADQLVGYECVVDLVYTGSSRPGTPLARAARARKLAVVDGLELLVGQGALSFEIFTGLSAPIGTMRAAARGDRHPPE